MARKTVEVDEEDLVRSEQLRNTLGAIMRNPKAKLLAQQAHKLVDPNAITPELDAATAQNDSISGAEKKINEFIAAQEKRDADKAEADRLAKLNSDFESGRRSLKSQKWTDDGIKKLEEFMEQKGILDHEIAAAAFEKLHPPPTPVTPGGSGSWNFLDLPTEGADADLQKLIESKGENSALIDKMAHEAINEVRGQSRR